MLSVNWPDGNTERNSSPGPKTKRIERLPLTYVAYDLETTGTNSTLDYIAEVAAIHVVNGIAIDSFESLVALPPGKRMPHGATTVNHITDNMLADAPTEAEVMPRFHDFIADDVLVGQNIGSFDNKLTSHAFDRLGLDFVHDYVDTLVLARRLWPSECNSLEEGILPRLGIVNVAAHRALSDVGATSAAYLRMRDALLDRFGSEDAFFDRYAGGSRDLHDGNGGWNKRWADKKARDIVADTDGFDPNCPVYDKYVLFTGDFECGVERGELMQIVKNLGGEPQDGVTRKTDYLVQGNEDFRSGRMTAKIKKAIANREKGFPVTIMSEEEFMTMMRGWV